MASTLVLNSEDCGTSMLPYTANEESIQVRTRSYQAEMWGASLRENIIVAMDTGSGKTHIAILRIATELNRLPPEKIIWFLTPSVALCEQQHRVISDHFPAVQVKLLLGSDNVDCWSKQEIWDAALSGVRVMVSTHAILSDALGHGFVKMGKLGLLIFDEAHHCTRGHAANQIMRVFYHPRKAKLGPKHVPHILGLTASPIVRSKPEQIRNIEVNLDSLVRTPRKNMEELLACVHQPILKKIIFSKETPGLFNTSSSLASLLLISHDVNLYNNFGNLRLSSGREARRLQPTVATGDLPRAKSRLEKFIGKAEHIQSELGPWATDYYIISSIAAYKEAMRESGEALSKPNVIEKDRIMVSICQFKASDLPALEIHDRSAQTSAKFQGLLNILFSQHNSEFCGLIFVEQKATVIALNHLLSVHPKTKGVFRCGTFVGMSNHGQKKTELGDLLAPKQQLATLSDFRKGKTNLIITTNALEEGIDVSACNTVICFNKPPNLKSFIQRRGRARKEKSTFFIMIADTDEAGEIEQWTELERQMTEMYQDHGRRLEESYRRERIQEEGNEKFTIESTGAILTFKSAVGHLYHFCDALPAQPYVDLRPTFSYMEDDRTGLVMAQVTLPSSLDPSIRQAFGSRLWRTERMARQDAAFQAYVGLYRAGLVNQNLLHSLFEDQEALLVEKFPTSIIPVSEQYNPWVDVAQKWNIGNSCCCKIIEVQRPSRESFRVFIVLPLAFRSLPPFPLFLDEGTVYYASVYDEPNSFIDFGQNLPLLRASTDLILRSIYGDRMQSESRDFVTLFAPLLKNEQLKTWLMKSSGAFPASGMSWTDDLDRELGIIRVEKSNQGPFFIQGLYRNYDHEARGPRERTPGVSAVINAVPLPSRQAFLQNHFPKSCDNDINSFHTNQRLRVVELSADLCTIDNLTYEFALFALFAPSILHRIEVGLVADELCKRMRHSVDFSQVDLVIAAICAPSAQESSTHLQLEFLGSSLLKYFIARQIFVNHTKWHEGRLAKQKDLIMSGARLAQAALESNLDHFIITERFSGRSWRPLYISDLQKPRSKKERMVSVKTLAGATEAMLGAAFLDGGYQKAASCASFFLHEIKAWPSTSLFDGTFDATRPKRLDCPAHFADLERLLGYTFDDKSLLLEAMTHPSCEVGISTSSYQRLAFLGDAVLEMVVVGHLFRKAESCKRAGMHLLKAASTNAKFLAFLCMEFSIDMECVDIQSRGTGGIRRTTCLKPLFLWSFMAHQNQNVIEGRNKSLERFTMFGQHIRSAVSHGTQYPWHGLAQLNPDKFFSDVIQSLFGAVFIDSKGDMTQCELLANKIGVFSSLRQMTRNNIDLIHPKSRLAELVPHEKVTYEKGGSGESELQSWCAVRVGDREMARASGGSCREEMEIRVAELAVEAMRAAKMARDE